ncbi:MAG: hypothetical protein GXX91_05980 [Verrucomicrobiaceae bacterium]|nr:hypothetical protein [Verrucomicrobiaceae bacterium]
MIISSPSALLATLLFTLVALASFATWALGSHFFSSEAAMYTMCSLVFLGLGGLALMPAAGLPNPRSRLAFCLRFAIGFIAYSLLWSVSWFTFRDTFGEVIGSFSGLLALVAILGRGRRHSSDSLLIATAIVFLWHTLGYYTGGFAYKILQGRGPFGIEPFLQPEATVILARFSWGLCYGLGLGAGLTALLQRSRQI